MLNRTFKAVMMKSYKQLWLLFILLLLGCKSRYYASDKTYSQYKIERSASHSSDSLTEIEAFLAPYRDSLNKEMNEVIGQATIEFNKDANGGTLGHLVVQAMEATAATWSKKPLSGTITNSGGLRIGQIPKGPITVGKIYELLPFENELVIVEVPGKVLEQWMNLIDSKGGWPTSEIIPYAKRKGKLLDAYFNISASSWRENNNTQILSLLKKLEAKPDSLYYIATNDYIAQGGDNCDFLKDCKKQFTGQLLRTICIEYIRVQKNLQLTYTVDEQLLQQAIKNDAATSTEKK
jgi:2',3'-cyclic-nucleotide 2'-phosphodiesterase (5'-nucleotidase family)